MKKDLTTIGKLFKIVLAVTLVGLLIIACSSCQKEAIPEPVSNPVSEVSNKAKTHFFDMQRDWETGVINPCTNDTIHLTGTAILKGNVDMISLNLVNLKGTGQTGTQYTGTYSAHIVFNYPELNVVYKLHFTAPGGHYIKFSSHEHARFDNDGNYILLDDRYTSDESCN